MSTFDTDRDHLRRLAARYRQIAESPQMAERRRLWTALKDLRAERPMLHFEVWTLGEDFLAERELVCQDPLLRRVERDLTRSLRQFDEVGDDLAFDPVWKVNWQTNAGSYGVDLGERHATDSLGGNIGYHFAHPIQTPKDLDRLQPRQPSVDRAATKVEAERLTACFGDVLPVMIDGVSGGCLHSALTQDLFKLIGNDNLLLWLYDEPEALQRAIEYLRDDRLAGFRFLEREGLLGANATSAIVGSGSPGYVSALPATTPAGGVRLNQTWTWMESQETTMVSPKLFARAFLPAMAEVAKLFGLVYYGCCEPVHDRWQQIRNAIPNIRAVTVSPWCDQRSIAGQIGREVVFSRKPKPPPISGEVPNWGELEQDLDSTLEAAAGCNLEILYRDVYRINGDRPRLRKWVELARRRIDARLSHLTAAG